jgi:damage-control phosphatase, subfamily I
LHLAIAGNIIDFGAKHDFSDELIHKEIDDALKVELNNDTVEKFRQSIENAENILYLGDNSGEIVFDKLFIEQLPREKITFAVRGSHIINDALLEDAKTIGLTNIVNVIDNGFNAPGTVLKNCSEEFQTAFNNADLIISKGQGNYETLSESNKNIVFLLKIKCDIVARDLKGKVGDFVIKTQ